MDPVSMVAIGATAAGGIVGAFGAAQKDEATANMDLYKAGVARANAQIAKANADAEREVGAVREQQYGLEGAQKVGQIRVDQAASGLQIGTGSAGQVVASQRAGIQQGEGIITADSARKAYGYEVQGFDFTAEAGLDTMAAQNVKAQEGFDVASSLLGSASQVATKWKSFQQAGIPGFGGGTPITS